MLEEEVFLSHSSVAFGCCLSALAVVLLTLYDVRVNKVLTGDNMPPEGSANIGSASCLLYTPPSLARSAFLTLCATSPVSRLCRPIHHFDESQVPIWR
ncbi:hypothetical protein BU26DRAFT_264811 [Trematosphaeria pertusa]|uniref:Uncharacterized protein n=1 Tax=Trematosphaeria pertusa TaxID=390896 RepID=A0A6A6IKY7_9PLEO|nr:uncharacterized protein BU26DRAFT_264811 [Trematosphaeria pertusa]KAF2250512.1 hypothetical protein BU26DRAFT_264811 [Trematosphaeria pertusa]